MVYKYLGYGVTDSNGVAKLDHDAEGQELQHSYTGVGAGEVDVVASLDNPVSSGSIVSETQPLWDYIKYDYATQLSHNDIWTSVFTGGNLTRNTDYSTIDEGTIEYVEYRVQIPNADCIIEFDMRQDFATGWSTTFVQGTSQLTGAGLGEANTWSHIKIELKGNTIKYYKDNSATPFITRNVARDITKNLYFGFCTPQSLTTIDFKDFKVYRNNLDYINIGATASIIQTTDTVNINGELYENGVLVKNTNIDVYKNGSKVGTVSTGSTGVASYPYTGVGAGENEFYFKYGSIVSETFVVTDCQYIDYGTSDNHQTWKNESASTFRRNNTGTTITASTSFFPRIEKTITGDFEATFYASMTNTIRITLYDNNDGSNQIMWVANQSDEVLFRVRRVGTEITVQHSTDNGATWSANYTKLSGTITNEDVYLGFVISTTNERSITFHDLKVYPI